jgi:hypothetical protein
MKITTQQAAELLNVRPNIVWKLTRAGKIKNLATPKEGSERANGRYDLAEVAEFAKTYIPRRRGSPKKKEMKENREREKNKNEEIIRRTLDVLLERTKTMDGRLGSIEFALITLDQKIDNMVKQWT